MRLDPKFFNRFIAICAAITFVAIVYYTIRHSSTQVHDFRNNIENVHADTLTFYSYTHPDSLKLSDLQGSPVVIQFWSTWSGKSQAVNSFLNEYISEFPNLSVIAAVVRDDESLVLDYIENQNYPFLYADGTTFYQTVYVPGIPSQIFINSAGEYVDFHIGDDTSALRDKLSRFLQDE